MMSFIHYQILDNHKHRFNLIAVEVDPRYGKTRLKTTDTVGESNDKPEQLKKHPGTLLLLHFPSEESTPG